MEYAFSTLSLHFPYTAQLEGYDASVWAPKILHEAGVSLVLKSDHPVLFSKDLVLEAAKAHHYGLPAQAALVRTPG